MSRPIRLTLVFVILLAALPVLPAVAQGLGTCTDGTQQSGAVYRICMPASVPWNNDLVIYAHGYVPNLGQPVAIPEDQLKLPDGTSIPDIINSLGYAFATTSYSTNGLAVLQGMADAADLANLFKGLHTGTRHVYLVGASEGGLVTTLAVERFPTVFSGGLATCGPVGDFRKQINYWGDFRVVFDYFFPYPTEVFPRWTQSNITIPTGVMANWPALSVQIANDVISKPHATEQLLRVMSAPVDPTNSATVTETVLGVLWYNVFATNDGMSKDKLGGNPFDNQQRWYFGSDNDLKLNSRARGVARFTADPVAIKNMAAYQTSGRLSVPLVTIHTTGDPIVPYWHEPLYRLKTVSSGNTLLYSNIPILRYGHCNFKASEVLTAFALLVLKVTGQELTNAQRALPDASAQAEFLRLAKEHGALH